MTTNLNRIRNALKNNNVVLTRGELRIDKPEPPVEVLPPDRSHISEGGAPRSTTDEPTSVRLKPTTWAASVPWYEIPRYAARLEAEVHAVQSQFPSARLACLPRETLVWQLPIRSLSGRSYDIAIQYPNSFPLGEPAVFVLSETLKSTPHQFADGRLCLGHAFARETSALTTAAWAAAWLSAYELYLETDSWPEFHPHTAGITR